MFKRLISHSDLKKLQLIASEVAMVAKIGDIFLIYGELGAGKTTFVRFFINSIFKRYSLKLPNNIKSPSFPIMINYPVNDFQIFHYDLYRLKDKNDLIELNIDEHLKKNITLIEWPDIFFDAVSFNNYFLVELKIIDENIRNVDISYRKMKK